MKLLCPHCAKVIDVSDSLAGQTTNCSLCQGPLTVPFAPPGTGSPASVPMSGPPAQPGPLPPPPPPPSAPDPLGHTAPWTPTSGYVPPLPSSSRPQAPSRGAQVFERLKQIAIPDTVLHNWLGLATLTIIFFLFFFSWMTVNVGDTTIVSQSGFSVGFGMSSSTPEGKFLTTGLPGSTLIVIAFFASLVGFLLLIAILVEKLVQAPAVQSMKPTLQRIASLRDPIVLGCLTVIALIFLLHYLFASFPLEQAAWTDKATDTMLTGLKLKTDGIEKVKSPEMVPLQWLRRTSWFGLATLLAFVVAVWVGCRWCSARGYCRRWPRIVLQWPGSETPPLTFDGDAAKPHTS